MKLVLKKTSSNQPREFNLPEYLQHPRTKSTSRERHSIKNQAKETDRHFTLFWLAFFSVLSTNMCLKNWTHSAHHVRLPQKRD